MCDLSSIPNGLLFLVSPTVTVIKLLCCVFFGTCRAFREILCREFREVSMAIYTVKCHRTDIQSIYDPIYAYTYPGISATQVLYCFLPFFLKESSLLEVCRVYIYTQSDISRAQSLLLDCSFQREFVRISLYS